MPRCDKVLVDTNVALDLVLGRQEFLSDALQVFALAEAGQVELLMPTDAVSTIAYIVSRNQGKAAAREAIAKLLDFVTLAALDERAVFRGLALDFDDIEDSLVAAVAEKEGSSCIVTRNKADFKGSPVLALTPREFLAAWAAKLRGGAKG